MKLFAVALLLATTLCQNSSAAETAPTPSLLGTWAVDTLRLPMAPAARPKSVTIIFSSQGADHLRTQVAVVDPTGAKFEADGVTPLDGSPTAVTSNFEADLSATTMPTAGVLIMQLAKDGTPTSTRIYALGADGDSMVETVAFFDENGRPVQRKNYFSRIR